MAKIVGNAQTPFGLTKNPPFSCSDGPSGLKVDFLFWALKRLKK